MIAPRTPCPVLYGIRGSSSSEVEKAHIWLQSEKGVESCKSYAIHRSNQISDDHIESTDRGQSFVNLERQRGARPCFCILWRQSLNLVAFQEGGPVNRLLRTLEPGDKITWVGLHSPDGSIHLERLRIDSATLGFSVDPYVVEGQCGALGEIRDLGAYPVEERRKDMVFHSF